MKQRIYSGYHGFCLQPSLQIDGEQSITVTVQDSEKPTTVLYKRTELLSGKNTLTLPLPQTGNKIDLFITNQENNDKGLQYLGFEKTALVTRPGIIDFETFHLDEFMRFIVKFCFNLHYLRTNDPYTDDYYVSDQKHFFIKLLPYISDYTNGALIDTPTRICTNTRLLEVSMQHCKDYTFPEMIALMLHEYCHGYANKNPNYEGEADLNSLVIYWSYGYPKIEAGQAWLKVFNETPSDENMQRMNDIVAFLSNIENIYNKK